MHERVKDVLDTSLVLYKERLHKDASIPIRDPNDFARSLGYEVGRITKTLLLKAVDRELFCLVVLSSHERLNMQSVAEVLQVKRVQMANEAELSRTLGYPPTGVSPIGANELPVMMDEGLMGFPTVLIGSGEVGAEIEISPEFLKKITQAKVLPLIAQRRRD